MMNVAIIGCGKMADQHAVEIRKIAGAGLVAACDAEPLMARQIAERFRIPAWYTSVSEMLTSARPDVVHVTTPPQSHFAVGKQCIEAGAHVYIEKPFTLDTGQALQLIELADRKGVKLTAGHNGQFTHSMNEMRRLVNSGFLGGRVVHIESLYGYELGDAAYAAALLGDSNHWARKLPGSLLQNIVSHGIARIAELLSGDHFTVSAQAFSSPFLQGIGQGDIFDELRLIITDDKGTTAHFTFSSQIAPCLHQVRVYGTSGSLVVDDDHQVVLRLLDKEYKSYLRFFVPPLEFARQYVGNWGRNVRKFLRNDFHLPNEAGLQALTAAFYRSIAEDAPLPISYREILLTSQIMDAAFEGLRTSPQTAITSFSLETTSFRAGAARA